MDDLGDLDMIVSGGKGGINLKSKLKDGLSRLKSVFKGSPYASAGEALQIYIAATTMLSQLLISFIILLGFAAIFIVLYYLIYVIYPRPFGLGHTEPFEQFMKEYIADLLNTLQYCAKNTNNLIDSTLSKECKNILGAKCTPVANRPDYYLFGGFRNLNKDPIVFTPDDCTPEQLPALYIYFMYYEASTGAVDPKTFDELKYLISEEIPYAPGITSAVTRDKILPSVKKDLAAIHTFFQNIRVPRVISKPNTQNPFIDIGSTHLCLLASYRAQIWNMYDFRKDKSFFGLFWTLLYDYWEYIFEIVLKRTWSTLGRDIVDASNAMVLWFTSEPVRKFVMSIPFRIAGIDPYENAPNPSSPLQITETFAPFTKPGDTVETLGFLKGLLELPKAFILLPQFLGTIIKFFKLLTKPFDVFRLVIGLIFGIIILIIYIIISVVASIVFIIPATIKVVYFKILETIIWILLLLFVIVFYAIIVAINYVAGGSLTGLVRCEDLPTAWLKHTNFMFGNIHIRRFFCNGTCRGNFLTTAHWCSVSNRPSQCPQQVIYELFHESFWKKASNPMAKETNSTFEFKPDFKYMSLKSEEREKIIREHLRQKYKYLEDCYKQSTSWNNLTHASKRYKRKQTHPINQDIFIQSSLSVCEFVSKYGSQLPESTRQELEYLCNETYCRQEYKPIYRSKYYTDYVVDLQGKPTFTFCKTQKSNPNPKDYETINKTPINVLNGFITVSFGCILIGILFAVFVHVKPGNNT
jgi:hypothetical protein